MPSHQFDWTREVPREWQADLDRLGGGEHVSRLVLHWNAGFEYDPVQRWCVWETLPVSGIGKILDQERRAGIRDSFLRGLWKDLNGPDPRTTGKWIPDDSVAGGRRWSSKSLVSRMQWDIHKATGGFPLLCWIIEGDRGGHSWQFGPFEQGFLLAAGADPEAVDQLGYNWPNPGSQPYADYDQRVFHALAERDLLVKWRKGLSWEGRSDRTMAGLILDGEAGTRREDMMGRVMRWLDNQIGDAVSDIPRKLLPQWSEFAAVESASDEERAHTQVIEGV